MSQWQILANAMSIKTSPGPCSALDGCAVEETTGGGTGAGMGGEHREANPVQVPSRDRWTERQKR